MSFDISKLTSVVNKYLNSISEVSNLGQKIQQEIADKGRFSVELSSAIQKEIDSAFEKTADTEKVLSMMANANAVTDTSAVANTADTAATKVSGVASATAATKVSGVGSAAAATNDNRDAYSGILSTEALQELSKSGYFSGNLIQDSLFKEDNSTENNNTSSSSAFEGVSLSDLNNNSLLANDILKAYAKSATSISPTSIFGDFSL